MVTIRSYDGIKEEVAVDLKQQREVSGLSQTATSLRSRVPRTRLSAAECGEIELRPDEVAAVREVLRKEIERRATKLQNALSNMPSVGTHA